MPFVAIDKDTGQRVDITRVRDPRNEIKSGQCICQLCRQPMIVRAGNTKAAHFSHYSECGDSEWQSHPESPEHREGKRYVAAKLPQEWPEYRMATIEYEVPIKGSNFKRIADVLATFPSGQRVAHEVQFASITPAELEERTRDYQAAGVDVVWWLGKAAKTDNNRAWCESYFGFSIECNISLVASPLAA